MATGPADQRIEATDSVEDWLKTHGLEQYLSVFIENEVDFRTLRILTDADLQELGLPFGPRKRLLNALADTAQQEITASSGERRQLTVLFCDIVGFTELSQRVDPEVLQNIARIYEDACAVCVTRYEGYVYQRLGDGIVAVFGYPLAHEGEAERAIRAGLEIIEKIARLDVPEVGRLKVRIGIASGIVVIATGEKNLVGNTLNLAARLQSVAKPGTVVVSERVRKLARGEFDYDDLGEFELKGIATPTRAFRVTGISSVETRFDAASQKGMMPLVGRDREVDALLERWRLIQDRKAGQAVLLSGEPGIGKSRLLSTLREHLEAEGVRPLQFQCSPFYVNSAYYPITVHLERALKIERGDTPETKMDKLEEFAVTRYGLPMEDMRFLAAIMSIPYQERYGAIANAPRLAKVETIRVLVNLLQATASVHPSLMLFEDAHWADPTSLEVLEQLFEHLRDIPLLVLVAHRPDFEPKWRPHEGVSKLSLSKLTSAQSGALIAKLAGGKKLPDKLAQQIIRRAEGVPLFVEELTKTILESGDLVLEGQRFVYSGTSVSVAIPETLRDLLMARLDRTVTVKRVAQVGAVIGREFSYDLIAALNVMGTGDLDEALAHLAALELAFCRGVMPNAVFRFKHALVQDAAYDSLLKSERKQIHGKIAAVLEERWPDVRDGEPELLAHHYTEAGRIEAAVPYWKRAGEAAMRRFALTEAITYLRKGMQLLETLPSSPERDLTELGLRTMLGPAIVAQYGWGHGEISVILEPAWRLAELLEHNPSYVPVLNALSVHYLCIDKLARSREWADSLMAAGTEADNDDLIVVGHRAASASCFWLGDFSAARKHGDIVQSIYDPERHWHLAQLTNTDPLTGEGIYRAQYLWMTGYPDQALAASEAKDANARRRGHPFDLAFSLTLGAQVFDFLSEPEELLRRTEEAERVGRQHGVVLLSEVLAEISRGIALLHSGQPAKSVTQLDKAITKLAATGHRIWINYLQALRAQGLALSGDLNAAMTILDESLQRIESGEERAHYAEVLRLKGWLHIQRREYEEAERWLRASIDVARRQQAKSWELRATATLARLLADQGEEAEARAMLSESYNWFTEGFHTRDLREAKALLDSLGG